MRAEKSTYALLVNKSSNSGRGAARIEDRVPLISEILKNSEIFYVSEGESLKELASRIADQFDCIVACGGDGTVKSVVSGIIGKDVILGVLPMGSGNDFSKMLGISALNFGQQLKVIRNGKVREVDLFEVNGEITTNTYGIGFNGYTNYRASLSGVRGPFKYLWAGLRALISTKPASMHIKTKEIEYTIKTRLVALANGKWEGGRYLISERSDHSDGQLELLILKEISLLRLALEFIKLSLGGSLSERIVYFRQVKSATITSDSLLFAHSDGEVIKPCDEFRVSLLPAAIKVFTA